MLLAATVGLGVPLAVKLPLAAAVAAHGVCRRPRSDRRVVVQQPDGRWGLPDLGRVDLSFARGTSYTTLWARLVLTAGSETFDILFLKDQFDPVSWRGLQARLRSASLREGPP